MTILKIRNHQAAQAHKLMHDLRIHHDAPELEFLSDMITLPDNDYIWFNTRDNPDKVVSILKSHISDLDIIIMPIKRGWFW